MSRRRAGPDGFLLCVGRCVFSSVGGAVPVTVQISACLVSRSPTATPPETTGRPMGAATPYSFLPHELLGRCMGFLFSFRFIVGGVSICGGYLMSVLLAFQVLFLVRRPRCSPPLPNFHLLLGSNVRAAKLFLALSFFSSTRSGVGSPKLRMNLGFFLCIVLTTIIRAYFVNALGRFPGFEHPPLFLPPPHVLPWFGLRNLFACFWWVGGGPVGLRPCVFLVPPLLSPVLGVFGYDGGSLSVLFCLSVCHFSFFLSLSLSLSLALCALHERNVGPRLMGAWTRNPPPFLTHRVHVWGLWGDGFGLSVCL